MNTNIIVSIIMAGCCIIALGLTLGLARKNIKNYYKKNKNMIFLPVLCGLFGVAAIVCGVWCLGGGGGKWCNLSSNSSPSGTTPIPPSGTTPIPPSGTTPIPPSGTTPIPPSGTTPEPDVGPVAPTSSLALGEKSACIGGIGGNVCFTPYQHQLGSFALQDAVEKEKANNTEWGKTIKKIEDAGGKVLFGTGSAGVANNINKDGTQGGQVGYNNGNCYQIRINNDNMGNDENEPPFTDVIMQSINTGLPNAFDIQMPAGGAGAFPDEGWGTCSYIWGTNLYGGNANSPGSNRTERTQNIQDSWLCYGGGEDEQYWIGKTKEELKTECAQYFDGIENNRFEDSEDAKNSYIESCAESILAGVACPYQSNNHSGSSWQPVVCPDALMEVTGLNVKNSRTLPEKPWNYVTGSSNPPLNTSSTVKNTKITSTNYKPENSSSIIGANFVPKDENGNQEPLLWGTNQFGDSIASVCDDSDCYGADWSETDTLVEVTQMQDCRSPDSSQCYKLAQDSDPKPNQSAAFNVNANGKIITEQGWHGCHNLPFAGTFSDDAEGLDPDPKSGNTSDGKRLKGNWTNNLEASFYRWQNQNESDKTIINPEVYSVVNCPIAFPPGQDSCTRYNNSQNCSNMNEDLLKTDDIDISTIDFTDSNNWSASSNPVGYNINYPNGIITDQTLSVDNWEDFIEIYEPYGEIVQKGQGDCIDKICDDIGYPGPSEAAFTITYDPDTKTITDSSGSFDDYVALFSENVEGSKSVYVNNGINYIQETVPGADPIEYQQGQQTVSKGPNYSANDKGLTDPSAAASCIVTVLSDTTDVSKFGIEPL